MNGSAEPPILASFTTAIYESTCAACGRAVVEGQVLAIRYRATAHAFHATRWQFQIQPLMATAPDDRRPRRGRVARTIGDLG